MANREYAELINLAAEMAQGRGMVSEHWDDHKWYRSTPMAERRNVIEAAMKANEQCRDWAVRLRAIANRLSEQHTAEGGK